ncbi:hypothetical protein COU56_02145 [Candidatus Pacearchaeota archaeon CG10_big_fil_rev_8_21_14_0_10_31_9]|nr:MAG: hypothetical protein AUJ62_01335 [Candidatus Pacearchaeota archaeon CG1_02_32_21]PIN95043.1 MAG: hypothetical protein COU56_02145 [Candidatus Pacearchaeota archaeon CG10_big_fil_rev_8_21_14_0_10_31_9]PIZ82466.1 MAG: hypothetical protein COX97_04745 [Candidatus Pacearchaeota archaeon CG_4_10_14_0_2_um_filter_05_32_18]
MYIELKDQSSFIQKAIIKAGSQRKLSNIIDIPHSSIDRYLSGGFIPDKRFELISNFLEIKNSNKLIKNKFENNFRQRIGGKSCVEFKKRNGTFERDMKNIQNKQSERLKQWHSKMKRDNPKEYYSKQYSRFKKIGGYKYKSKNGEKVRNLFEKQVADILFDLRIDYEYEPLINVRDQYFFPDFLINKKIIFEVTAWEGETKAYKLKDKISYLDEKYKVYVIIPKHLYKYYKILNNHLILGLDDFASVAQTILADMVKNRSNR